MKSNFRVGVFVMKMTYEDKDLIYEPRKQGESFKQLLNQVEINMLSYSLIKPTLIK